jgi:hypothetical protein
VNVVSVWKISASGLKVTLVPRLVDLPSSFSDEAGSPRRNDMWWILSSRQISTSSHSESAFTTDAPTPWSPPETL